MSIKVLSLNVKGLGNESKRRSVFNYCRQRAQIGCLQETHSCKLEYDRMEFALVNIYAPNKDSPAFFLNMIEQMVSLPEKRIIIGDFNLALDEVKDRKNCTINNDKAKSVVETIMAEYLLTDIWRARNQESERFSYFARKGKKVIASRIDFALVSQGLDSQVESIFYIPGIMTDHSALFVSLNPHMLDQGRGYWKF